MVLKEKQVNCKPKFNVQYVTLMVNEDEDIIVLSRFLINLILRYVVFSQKTLKEFK